MSWRDNFLVVECDGCGEDALVPNYKNEDQEKSFEPHEYVQVDRGFCLDFSGHYGGFTDDMEGARGRAVLCHDCCVKLARLFPKIFPPESGFHSIHYKILEETNHQSCCEFAWMTLAGETWYGDGSGGWTKKLS